MKNPSTDTASAPAGVASLIPGLPDEPVPVAAGGPVPTTAGAVTVTPPGSTKVGRRRWRRPLLAAGAVLVAAAVAAATTLYARADHSSALPAAASVGHPITVAPAAVVPVATLSGAGPDGKVPWQGALTVKVTDGTLTGVAGTDSDGGPVTGTLAPDGSWTSTTGLLPSATYTLSAAVRDAAGDTRQLPLTAQTTAPQKVFKVTLAPGDGAVVGVGQAISLRLGTAVTDPAVRAALERKLTVTATPAVEGSWRWMSSTELRYRGAVLWPAGAKVTVTAAMDHVALPGGLWGGSTRTASFSVGDALTSVVDTRAHLMTVSRNGQVVRVMKASTGKPQFATRNGTFVVLEKFADRIMDSATVDLPPGTPPYRTAVKDAVRITNSGTFTHGAPWSVASQGRANVSHGCINLSPVDADWYFHQVTRGDVVTVVNSTVGPNLSDAGSQDWNMSYAQWKSGSALV